MYMYVYVYMCVCMYVYICIYVYVYVCMCVWGEVSFLINFQKMHSQKNITPALLTDPGLSWWDKLVKITFKNYI